MVKYVDIKVRGIYWRSVSIDVDQHRTYNIALYSHQNASEWNNSADMDVGFDILRTHIQQRTEQSIDPYNNDTYTKTEYFIDISDPDICIYDDRQLIRLSDFSKNKKRIYTDNGEVNSRFEIMDL